MKFRRYGKARKSNGMRRYGRALRVETLEPRRLLALSATLVDDLTPGTADTFESDLFTEAGGTDQLVAAGDNLFFRSRYLFAQNQLYAVAANSLTPLEQLSANGGFLPTAVDDSVYFFEDDGLDATLWSTDGTPGNTGMVLDIGDNTSFEFQAAEVGGLLLFVNSDSSNGAELWALDPNEDAPNGPLANIRPGVASSNPVFHGVAGGKLYFTAQTAPSTFGLWASDGTAEGTEQILSDVGGLVVFNNFLEWNDQVVFLQQTGDGQTAGDVLWATDGTAAMTRTIDTPTLIDDGSADGVTNRAGLAVVGDSIYFTANAGAGGGLELWRTDEFTSEQLSSNSFDQGPANFIVLAGDLFFTADDGATGNELWRADLDAGVTTSLVADINTQGDADPDWLTEFNGKLLFVADDRTGDPGSPGTAGRELRYFDPIDESLNVLDDIYPGADGSGVPNSASPRSLLVLGRQVFLTAEDPVNGRELWAVSQEDAEIDVLTESGTPIPDEGGPILFPNTAIGDTVTQTFRIRNLGSSTLVLTGPDPITITGDAAADYSVTVQPADLMLEAGEETTFEVEFSPTETGLRTAVVNIANNDSDENPYNFTIQSSGLAPDINLTGNGLTITTGDVEPELADGTDFGIVPQGETAVQTFTIENTGSETLDLNGAVPVQITGLHPSDFRVIAGPELLMLAPGEMTTFDIEFDPNALGPRFAAVVIVSNDPDESPYTFAITGTANPPGPDIRVLGNGISIEDGDVTPSVLDGTAFVTSNPGQLRTQVFTIQNTGLEPLNLIGAEPIIISGEDADNFTVLVQPGQTTLAPSQTTTFEIQLNAIELGVVDATVIIDNDDPNENPFDFAIRASIAPITVDWTAQGPTPAVNGQVENIGGNNPVTGAIHTVLAHPTNPNILHIGAVNGGIWKTTNATGLNPIWTPVSDFHASLSISAMAWDLSDNTSSTLWAANGRYSSFGEEAGGTLNGVMVSTDAGDTWTNPGSDGLQGVNISGISAQGETVVVTSNTGGLYRSVDGGATFLPAGGFSTDTLFFDLVEDPNSHALYAAGGLGAGIHMSTDFGSTWNKITTTAMDALAATQDSDGESLNNNIEMAVHPSTGRLYAAILLGGKLLGEAEKEIVPGGIFFTDDPKPQGTTWTEMQQPALPRNPAHPVEGAMATVMDDGEGNEIVGPPIIITSAGHGLTTGDFVLVYEVEGMPANGFWRVTVIDGDNFSLDGSDPIIPDSDPPEAFEWVEGTGFWHEAVDSNPVAKTGLEPGAQAKIHFSIVADPSIGDLVYLGGDRQQSPLPTPIGAEDFSGAIFRGNTAVMPDGVTQLPLQWVHITHVPTDIGATSPGGTANSTAPHADSREMVFDALGNLIEVDDGGIYKRSSPQSSLGDWVSLIGNLQVSEIHDLAYDPISQTIITGTQDTGTQYQINTDQGFWISLSTGDGGDVVVDSMTLAAQNQSIRYSSNQRLRSFRKTTWDSEGNLLTNELLNPSPLPGNPKVQGQFSTPLQLNHVDQRRMLIGGLNGLFESLDQANTVKLLVPGLVATGTSAGNAIDYGGFLDGVPNRDVAYVGTTGGEIWVRTEENGIFSPTQVGGSIRDVIMDTDNWMNAFAVDSNQVYMTEDAGGSWSDITGDLFDFIDSSGIQTDFLRSLQFIPGVQQSAVVVGTNAGVFATLTSSIGDWFEIGANLPNAPVWDMAYDKFDDVLVVGTLGRGAWKLNDVGASIGAAINTFIVGNLDDVVDGDIGPGQMSLREAINEANALPGKQTIRFDPLLAGETFSLTQGPLVVTDSLSIIVDGDDPITIDATASDPTPDENNGDGANIFNFNNGNDSVRLDIELSNLVLTGGDTSGEGGAIRSRENLTLDNVTIVDNHADQIGGGLSHRQGSLTILNSTIEGNSNGIGHGGGLAVWNPQGNVLIQDTSVISNMSLGDGGGIDLLGGAGSVLINRVTVASNQAADRGGGIWATRPITVTSSTISGNSALDNGGGFWSNSHLNIRHSTVTLNTTANAGGGIFADDSIQPLTLDHTIVAGNSGGTGDPVDVGITAGRTATASFSLIGDNTGSGFVGTPLGVPDANGNLVGDPLGDGVIDPLLQALGSNGGPTMTHSPQLGSLAIDRGDADAVAGSGGVPLTDQRERARIIDGNSDLVARIDIGAFEFNPIPESPPGDYNGNGIVDLADITIWKDTFGSMTDLRADGNNNGVIDQNDRDVWVNNFGTQGSATGAQLASQPAGLAPAPLLEVERTDSALAGEVAMVSLALGSESSESEELRQGSDDFFSQLGEMEPSRTGRSPAMLRRLAGDHVAVDEHLLLALARVGRRGRDAGEDMGPFARDVDRDAVRESFGQLDADWREEFHSGTLGRGLKPNGSR